MPNRPTAFIIAVVFATLAAAPAAANPPCDVLPPLSELEGAYQVEIGNALVFADGRVVPLRASETIPVIMKAQDDLLMMEAGPNVIVFEYADPLDGAVDFKEFYDVLNVQPGHFAAQFGCALERLPVLKGGGLANSQEGTPIEFEYLMFLWDHRNGQRPEMMGTLSWSGGGIASVRAVTISPAN